MKDGKPLPYGTQSISAEDVDAVSAALGSQWLTTGPEVAAFEREIATYCGARHAVTCSSGTAALHLAALAVGLAPGDAVVTSPITFLATANCARYCGADVLFADVDARTANLAPSALERALQGEPGSRIKAVLPVHYAGHPAPMEELSAIARKRGVRVIEDACHALGAEYRGQAGERVRVGSCRHSDMTVFSFHPVKHVTTGEGGAITTNDDRLHARLLALRSHGMVREPSHWQDRARGFDADGSPNPWYYEMHELGFNYRLTDFQCALGRSQLKRLDAFLERRRALAAAYHALIGTELADRVRPLGELPGHSHAYHLFVVRIPFARLGKSRGAVMRALQARGIGTQVHYVPVHLQPYYRAVSGTGSAQFPAAEAFYEECLSLPMYPDLEDRDVERVVAELKRALG